ncbi:MAG: hypothetical protein CMO81_08305 [Waddliaceae bacterium]|nr:hypothetical protein [Waddliaceae bacterium]
MAANKLFTLRKGQVYAVPIVHYNMEMAAQVHMAIQKIQPDCIAVEFAETMQDELLHAASRLPDISVVVTITENLEPLYYLSEPCDAGFEALRSALELNIPAYCIDLDVDDYPIFQDLVPDPYAIQRLGLQHFYGAYEKIVLKKEKDGERFALDHNRELYMARRLKELSLKYDSVLFIGGMYHVQKVLDNMDRQQFPELHHAPREEVRVCTLTEESCRDVMAEYPWISLHYEKIREHLRRSADPFLYESVGEESFPPDRQKLLLDLYRESGKLYAEHSGNSFESYHLRNTMKYVRNYALITNKLQPNLFQLLSAAKGCVDHNYAYETWVLATEYPHLKNIDELPELDLSIEDLWGNSQRIHFHLKGRSEKSGFHARRDKSKQDFEFAPAGAYSICSYQPEDLVIENFGDFLKKKGQSVLMEESGRTQPFSTSLEDGIDTRETIRHWYEKKLYVKVKGKQPGAVGAIVVIFDPDEPEEDSNTREPSYPWCTTWLGEHEQESDMAFFATPMGRDVVGPGISRCEYGGFLLSYPPRRLYNVWQDPDYAKCRNKSEVLLMAAIEYSREPLITYVAASPPPSRMKSYARYLGRKVVYIPIGQISSVLINKLRVFHVLDSHDRRNIADDYIF